jgi:hypothetical protein
MHRIFWSRCCQYTVRQRGIAEGQDTQSLEGQDTQSLEGQDTE